MTPEEGNVTSSMTMAKTAIVLLCSKEVRICKNVDSVGYRQFNPPLPSLSCIRLCINVAIEKTLSMEAYFAYRKRSFCSECTVAVVNDLSIEGVLLLTATSTHGVIIWTFI